MAMYVPPRQTAKYCVVCGATDHLDYKIIKVSSIPSWFWFMLPIAPIPALLLAARHEVSHQIQMLVCARCRRRQKRATTVYYLTFVSCVVAFIAAIALGLANRSWLQFAVLSAFAGVVYMGGSLLKRRVYPRYAVLTLQQVEIEVPGRGRVIVFPT